MSLYIGIRRNGFGQSGGIARVGQACRKPGNGTDPRQTAKRKNATWAAQDATMQQPGSHERRTDGQEDDEKIALPDKAAMPGATLRLLLISIAAPSVQTGHAANLFTEMDRRSGKEVFLQEILEGQPQQPVQVLAQGIEPEGQEI